MDPYVCVTSDRGRAPIIADWPTAHRASPGSCKRLLFGHHAEKDAIILVERPLVEDGAVETGLARHCVIHNDRRAWSLVEDFLRAQTPAQLPALFAAGYAEGLANFSWEAGDDSALHYITEQYSVDVPTAHRLYDIMGTNNLTTCTTTVLVEGRPAVQQIIVPARQGFLPLLSRANHACAPSAYVELPCGVYSRGSGSIMVRAARRVDAGEELTIDYARSVPAAVKREFLLSAFGFLCACARCERLCAVLSCHQQGNAQCARCRSVRYCSAAHQREDWTRHKTQCGQIK